MSKENIPVIVNRINQANKILVISHVSPDADAYGSQNGLAIGLKKLGKQVATYNESEYDPYYNFIPEANLVTSVITHIDADLIIICDCGDERRIGEKSELIFKSGIDIINIDHHISNTSFGSFNLLDFKASSTCELIAQLLDAFNQDLIDIKVATCLLAGIYSDTGSFRYSSVSPNTLRIAANLMLPELDHQRLMNAMFSSRRLSALKLEAKVFSNLKLYFGNQVALITVKKRDLLSCSAEVSDTEGMVEKLRDVDGVQLGILIRVDGKYTKTSMRSLAGTVNVSKIAQLFGGGGHINAAGFRSKKSAKQVEEMLIQHLESVYKNS